MTNPPVLPLWLWQLLQWLLSLLHPPIGLLIKVDQQPVQLVRLSATGRVRLMQTVTVGHKLQCTIVYLDANGNPMQTTPTPDAPPTWTSAPSPANTDSLTVSADGTECDVNALNPGSDTLSLDVKVGGQSFTATLGIQVNAAPQVLTSVQILATVA